MSAESGHEDVGGCGEGGRSRLELIEDGVCPTCRKEYSGRQGIIAHHTHSHGESAITDEMLLAELDRLHDELGRVPVGSDMTEYGKYGHSAYERRFGGWNNTLRKAGYEPTHVQDISEEDLLAEIHRLYDELGRVPVGSDMTEYGRYSLGPYEDRFGGLNNALIEAGYSPTYERDISDGDLLAEIHRLYDELGRVPTARDISDYGKYSIIPYQRQFDGWNNALRKAGYDLNNEYNISDEVLLAEIHRLHDELGRVPAQSDMTDYGKYSLGPYEDRFGGWNNAVRKAGYSPTRERDIPDEDLLAEIHRLYDELGRVPIRSDIDRHGEYSPATYQIRFSGWNDSLIEAGYEPNYKYGRRHARSYGPNWGKQRRRAIERDDEQCVGCGLTREEHLEMWGEDLHVHHKRPLTTFPFVDDNYNRDWETVNALSNLMTCCRTCHPDLDVISRSMYPADEYPRHIRPEESDAETPAEAVQVDLLEFA